MKTMTTLRNQLRLLAAVDAGLAAVLFALGWWIAALAILVIAADVALLSLAPDRWVRVVARPLAALGVRSAQTARTAAF